MTHTPNSIISFIQHTHSWVDNILATLSLEEKIGQLIHVAAYSNRDQTHTDYILELIKNHHIGGLTFFQGHPIKQAQLTNLYQNRAKVPLMISIDGEWGLGMRLDETMSFPYQMALGAIEEDQLIYKMGSEIARQCKRLGIHVNFAPVVDVNNNPKNPVIGFRSFGENLDKIISKASAYMRGMQDQGILACVKHFPGHGDTDVDSHFDLPIISHSKERLIAVELNPFRKLFDLGAGSAMVSHLHIPAIDPVEGRAATLSPPIVNGLLKGEMQYKGLVFTDALDMKGVSKTDTPAEVGMKALLAGHDVLLNIKDVPGTIKEIKQALERGEISQDEIEELCRKNLAMKLWMGLDKLVPIDLDNLVEDLHPSDAHVLCSTLHEQSITLLGSDDFVLDSEKKIATVAVYAQTSDEDLPPELKQHALEKGKSGIKQQSLSPLQKTLNSLDHIAHFHADHATTDAAFSDLLAKLKQYDTVVLSLHGIAVKARDRFGISDLMIERVNAIAALPHIIASVYASAYVVDLFQWSKDCTILLGYQENEVVQQLIGEMLMGTKKANGKLPVKIR